jgi:hypothetical protein
MTIKELKEWLDKLPEETENYPLVIRELKMTEEEGKFGQKDDPIVSAMVDSNQKRLCVFNIESQGIIQKIRENVKPNKEEGEETPAE